MRKKKKREEMTPEELEAQNLDRLGRITLAFSIFSFIMIILANLDKLISL